MLLFHLKNMKYLLALPMFLMSFSWHENLLSNDYKQIFLTARSGDQRDVIFHEKNIHKILLDLLGK